MGERPAPAATQTALVTWVVIGTMSIAPFINYVFSALAPFLVGRTEISPGDIGVIVTVIFGVATLGSARAGVISDRRGPIWSSKLLLGFASGSLVAIVLGQAKAAFLVGAVMAGLTHALSHPTSNALVSEYVPEHRQGIVVGLKQSGVQVGQFVAGFLLPLLAPLVGWRLAVSTGFVIIAAAFVGLSMIRSPFGDEAPLSTESTSSGGRSALWLAVFALILGTAVQGTNVYLSLFAFEALDFTERAAGLMVGVVGAAGAVARIGWGFAVHRFATMWKPLVAISMLLLTSVLLFWFAMVGGSGPIVAGVALLSVSATAVSVLLSMALIRSSNRDDVGGNSGVVMRGLYAGYMAGPFLFGQIVELSGYPAAWAAMAAFCLVAVAAAGTVVRRVVD